MKSKEVGILDPGLLIHKFNTFPDMLISRLNEQRLKTSMCDAKVVTKEGSVFYAHKAVLAACSPYLEAELSSLENSKSEVETVINLGMISSISFQTLLDLVYTAQLKLSPENVGEVLLAADILDLEEVGDICRQYLRSQIKSKSVSKERQESSNSESSVELNLDENQESASSTEKQWSNDDVLFRQNGKPSSLKSRILNGFNNGSAALSNGSHKRPASAPSSFESKKTTDGVKRIRFFDANGNKVEEAVDLSPSSTSSNDEMYNQTPSNSDKSDNDEIEVMSPNPVENGHKSNSVFQPIGSNTIDMNHNHVASREDNEEQRSPAKIFPRLSSPESDKVSNAYTKPSSSLPQVSSQEHQSFITSLYLLQSRANALPSMLSKSDFSLNYRQMLQQSPQNISPVGIGHNPNFTCNICRLDLGSEWAYTMHQRLYHNFYRDYTTIANQQRDVQIVPQRSHSFSARNEVSPMAVPRFTKEKFSAGPMTHPIVEFAKGATTPKEKTKNTVHKCYHCDKEFSTIFELRKHKANEHVKRPFKCTVCHAAFPNKAGLSVHVRSHTGERPYKCKVCNKAFTQLGHVQRHQKVHTGEKPYQCPLCHARVRDKASMHYHILAHKGVKPFKCDQCDARFTKRSSLVKHKNVHTGDFLYQCSQCKASFREKASLSRHARSQHKEHVYMPATSAEAAN